MNNNEHIQTIKLEWLKGYFEASNYRPQKNENIVDALELG